MAKSVNAACRKEDVPMKTNNVAQESSFADSWHSSLVQCLRCLPLTRLHQHYKNAMVSPLSMTEYTQQKGGCCPNNEMSYEM